MKAAEYIVLAALPRITRHTRGKSTERSNDGAESCAETAPNAGGAHNLWSVRFARADPQPWSGVYVASGSNAAARCSAPECSVAFSGCRKLRRPAIRCSCSLHAGTRAMTTRGHLSANCRHHETGPSTPGADTRSAEYAGDAKLARVAQVLPGSSTERSHSTRGHAFLP